MNAVNVVETKTIRVSVALNLLIYKCVYYNYGLFPKNKYSNRQTRAQITQNYFSICNSGHSIRKMSAKGL